MLRYVLTTVAYGANLGPAQTARHIRGVSAHELLHALLHFELPRDPDSARTLIRRFRHQQLD